MLISNSLTLYVCLYEPKVYHLCYKETWIFILYVSVCGLTLDDVTLRHLLLIGLPPSRSEPIVKPATPPSATENRSVKSLLFPPDGELLIERRSTATPPYTIPPPADVLKSPLDTYCFVTLLFKFEKTFQGWPILYSVCPILGEHLILSQGST